METTPNRIRALREAAGISSEKLGEMCGTSGATIRRIETGNQQLTLDWMRTIAQQLKVWPSDLISSALVANIIDEVEPVLPDELSGSLRALASRGFQFYRVVADTLEAAGIEAGQIITLDASVTIDALRAGDCIVARLTREGHPPALVVRQFVPPGLLTTNRSGINSAIQINTNSALVDVAGLIIRD